TFADGKVYPRAPGKRRPFRSGSPNDRRVKRLGNIFGKSRSHETHWEEAAAVGRVRGNQSRLALWEGCGGETGVWRPSQGETRGYVSIRLTIRLNTSRHVSSRGGALPRVDPYPPGCLSGW